MIWNLLAEGDTGTTAGTSGSTMPDWVFPVVLIALVVLIAAWFIFSGRKNKQRQKEYVEQLEALRPGNKVKTAGGICGIVVEVCDDNTVVIETGSENSGKSYVKMDKELIAQTDAKGPTQIAREQAEAQRKAEKAAKKNGAASGKAETAEPAPAETPAAEEKPAETPEEKPQEPSESEKE